MITIGGWPDGPGPSGGVGGSMVGAGRSSGGSLIGEGTSLGGSLIGGGTSFGGTEGGCGPGMTGGSSIGASGKIGSFGGAAGPGSAGVLGGRDGSGVGSAFVVRMDGGCANPMPPVGIQRARPPIGMEGETMRPLHLGLSDEQREGSVRCLNLALCNEYLLLIKTKKAHWDVVGPQFLAIHQLLDSQYEQTDDFVDQLAERVRALGGCPVGTAAGFIEGATLREQPGKIPGATGIVRALLQDHEEVIRELRKGAERADVTFADRGTSDLFVRIMQAHEHMAWMLRSLLEGDAVISDGQLDLPRNAPRLA